jgi:signal transduction histidine kinase
LGLPDFPDGVLGCSAVVHWDDVRLPTKLTLAFAAVALLPIAVLVLVARVVIANQYRGEFHRALAEAERGAEREWRRLVDEAKEGTQRLGRRDDPALAPLLVALGRGAPPDEVAEAARACEAGLRGRGLDVVTLLDERGEVLAAPHLSGRAGDLDAPLLALARAHAGAHLLREETVLEAGHAVNRLAVESAREIDAPFGERRRVRLWVMGGRFVDERFLERVHPGALLLGLDGKVLLPAGAKPPPAGRPRVAVDLRDAAGEPQARVLVGVSDAELRRLLDLIGGAGLGLGAGALALALGLGALVARRLTRPLDELAEALGRVARGDLGAALPERGGDEVAQLARAFNAMVADLTTARDELVRAERVAAWREIAQRIAHEIKNPLTPIQMAIETLERARSRGHPQFDELFAESARTIVDEVERLRQYAAEFSRFARLPAPNLAPCDLAPAIEAALRLYGDGPVRLARALPPDLPPALADRDQITQVLLNLVENARDAVAERPAGEVRVSLREKGGRIELEVADNGPGLDEETRRRLFTPYFTTKAKGTGLGLAIVHRIVTDHGGEIRVGGAPGEGAVFVVSLRRANV